MEGQLYPCRLMKSRKSFILMYVNLRGFQGGALNGMSILLLAAQWHPPHLDSQWGIVQELGGS